MRDINRIEPFMNEIASIWKEKFPDLRFGQLMSNFFCALGDPFYYEEEELLAAFRAYARGEDPSEAAKKVRYGTGDDSLSLGRKNWYEYV